MAQPLWSLLQPVVFRSSARVFRTVASSAHLASLPCCAQRPITSTSSLLLQHDLSRMTAARGVTSGSSPTPDAAVKVEGSTLVEEGEGIHATPEGGSSPNAPSSSTRSTSPVPMSDGQDPSLGHLTSTSTHLLRLTLPLPSEKQPVSFVLHPAQPLSYLSRLIAGELPDSLPDVGVVQYRGLEGGRWSEATDLADFLRQTSNVKKFTIDLLPSSPRSSSSSEDFPHPLRSIEVLVPSFLSRTQYLRDRLHSINDQLRTMGVLKEECDRLARQGARRVAFGGLAGLVSYWVVVAVATLRWGWDIMEPVTYLVGHSVLIASYCYFLLHRREPGYHNILNRTISTRQAKLYSEHGFDFDRHQKLLSAGAKVREEIQKLAEEYGVEWEDVEEGGERPRGTTTEGKQEIKRAVDESERLEKKSKVKSTLKKNGDSDEKDDEADDDDDVEDKKEESDTKSEKMVARELKRLKKEKKDY